MPGARTAGAGAEPVPRHGRGRQQTARPPLPAGMRHSAMSGNEMVVLPRFDVFVAAAGVQVGQRLRPLPAMRGPLPAQCREVYPDEDACRYHEQQQNQ